MKRDIHEQLKPQHPAGITGAHVQFRSDAKLGNLPSEQRTKVDKWLFATGMPYAQVAEACHRFLGVQVSRSSVAAYHDKVMAAHFKRAQSSTKATKQCPPRQPYSLERFDEFISGLISAAQKVADEIQW